MPKNSPFRRALEHLQRLEAAGFESRFAGGCVRDRLLDLDPQDFDIATAATPEQVCLIFKQTRARIGLQGVDHGTVAVIAGGQMVEITTLRKDVSTDGRRATVSFSEDFREDALRRDFTINAMYEDAQGQIFDYFGGKEDLKNGILRFVGSAKERVREDFLRILRLYRFKARFGFEIAPGTEEALPDLVAGLNKVSQERITTELLLTLGAPFAERAIDSWIRLGLWKQIGLPQITRGPDSSLWPRNLTDASLLPISRLTYLMGINPTPSQIDKQLRALKLSNQDQKRIQLWLEIAQTLNQGPYPDQLLAMAALDKMQQLGESPLTDQFLVLSSILGPNNLPLGALVATEQEFGHLRRAKLPINGEMLKEALSLSPGRQLGLLLDKLKQSYRLGNWSTREQGLILAREWLAGGEV